MAPRTRTRLNRWLVAVGMLLSIVVGAAMADALPLPGMPEGTPWWVWAFVTIVLGGGTFVGAVATARRQARKTAFEEYQTLHAEERKGRQECEERNRVLRQQIDGQMGMILRLQTKNQRYILSNHKLRSYLAALAMRADIPLPDMSMLIDDIEEEHEAPKL